MNTQKLATALTDRLFASETKHLANQITRTTNQNNQELNRQSPGYVFQGRAYYAGRNLALTAQGAPPPYRHGSNMVHLSLFLREQGEEIQNHLSLRKREYNTIFQLLAVMLQPTGSIGEVLDALPECLVQTSHLQEYRARFPRRHDAGELLRAHNPAAHAIYSRWLPRIEAYSVSHLFE